MITWEAQKKAIVRTLREILETPNMVELEFNYNAKVGDSCHVEYRIKRVAVPTDEDAEPCS